jgi:protein TonB
MTVKPVKPLDDIVPVIVEPVAPPPPSTTEEPKEEPDKTPDDTPQIVAVVLDSPAVNFAVPTVGNLLLPQGMAALPPISPMAQAAVLQRQPTTINSTGRGGERPDPAYPPIALQQGLQGSVTLSITVDETGLITAIAVKQSSGSPLLDRSALEFVRKHWIIPPSDGSRSYEATITYRLKE